MPHRRIWHILLDDPVALTEVTSGLFLVFVRGAVLVGAVRLFPVGYDVAEQLRTIGVTEDRWGAYLMVCGLLQIFLARTPHTILRALTTLAILLGFVVMGAGYYSAYSDWRAVPASVICMAVLYTFLLARVGLDRSHASRGLAGGGR